MCAYFEPWPLGFSTEPPGHPECPHPCRVAARGDEAPLAGPGAAQPRSCPTTPWPQEIPFPIYIFLNIILISPAEPWAQTTGLFHVLPTAEALLQAPSLWGQSSHSSGAVVQRAQGHAAYVEQHRKTLFGSLSSSPDAHAQRQMLFPFRDCKKAVIFQSRDQGSLCAAQYRENKQKALHWKCLQHQDCKVNNKISIIWYYIRPSKHRIRFAGGGGTIKVALLKHNT